jgi:hypothetical protein
MKIIDPIEYSRIQLYLTRQFRDIGSVQRCPECNVCAPPDGCEITIIETMIRYGLPCYAGERYRVGLLEKRGTLLVCPNECHHQLTLIGPRENQVLIAAGMGMLDGCGFPPKHIDWTCVQSPTVIAL